MKNKFNRSRSDIKIAINSDLRLYRSIDKLHKKGYITTDMYNDSRFVKEHFSAPKFDDKFEEYLTRVINILIETNKSIDPEIGDYINKNYLDYI